MLGEYGVNEFRIRGTGMDGEGVSSRGVWLWDIYAAHLPNRIRQPNAQQTRDTATRHNIHDINAHEGNEHDKTGGPEQWNRKCLIKSLTFYGQY
jgi:hypothetical protein